MSTKITFAGGKYSICHENGTNLRALRYDKPWRDDIAGDGMILAMAQEIEQLREQLKPAIEEVTAESAELYALSERTEFEKSEVARHPGAHLFRMPEGHSRAGQYQNQHVESAWRAWSARAEEVALLREYRSAHINFNYSHGAEGGTLDQLVEIERKAEDRLERAERACHEFYAKS